MSSSDVLSSRLDASGFASVVGIDVGSQACVYTVLQPDKRTIVKPTEVANHDTGFVQLHASLSQLGVPPQRILIGLEATSRYSENLYQVLAAQGYVLCLLHPRQTHQFSQQRGLRAKTDQMSAATIARVLLSGEARPGYVPDELIATYREVERLHSQLAQDSARYQNQIQTLLVVLFPEFVRVFADPCRPTALALLKRYPSARALVSAGVEAVAATLHEVAARRYGRQTAQQLVGLATQSGASGLATDARALSLQILCDQLQHTLANLAQVEHELDQLLDRDTGVTGLKSTPEFGRKTVAVLRAELGDVTRGSRASIRSWPMPAWISRSSRAASGKGKSSSPNAAADACVACSIWLLCARSACRLLPSAPRRSWPQSARRFDGGHAQDAHRGLSFAALQRDL